MNINFRDYVSIQNIDLNQVQLRCIQLVKPGEIGVKVDYKYDRKIYFDGFDNKDKRKNKKKKKLLDCKNS